MIKYAIHHSILYKHASIFMTQMLCDTVLLFFLLLLKVSSDTSESELVRSLFLKMRNIINYFKRLRCEDT